MRTLQESESTASPRPVRVGPLAPAHRTRVRDILEATGVFRPDEVDVALELFDETFGESRMTNGDGNTAADPSDPSAIRHPPSAIASPSTGSDYLFLGAFTPEDELVGYACYGPTPETDRTFDLYWIAVDPRAQGSGGGTRLLSEVEGKLQREHARMLVIETSSRPEYAATRGFYLARGYHEAARVGNYYAPADDRVIYTKRFHPTNSPAGRGA